MPVCVSWTVPTVRNLDEAAQFRPGPAGGGQTPSHLRKSAVFNPLLKPLCAWRMIAFSACGSIRREPRPYSLELSGIDGFNGAVASGEVSDRIGDDANLVVGCYLYVPFQSITVHLWRRDPCCTLLWQFLGPTPFPLFFTLSETAQREQFNWADKRVSYAAGCCVSWQRMPESG